MKSQTISSYGLTLQQAKEYLHVETTDEDTLINALVTASYVHVCNECNRDFVQTAYVETFVSGSTEFLTSQEVFNLSTGSLVTRTDGSWVTFDTYFNGSASYQTAVSCSVPATVAVAQRLLINQWFDNRSTVVIGASVTPLDFCVKALLQPYQIVNPAP